MPVQPSSTSMFTDRDGVRRWAALWKLSNADSFGYWGEDFFRFLEGHAVYFDVCIVQSDLTANEKIYLQLYPGDTSHVYQTQMISCTAGTERHKIDGPFGPFRLSSNLYAISAHPIDGAFTAGDTFWTEVFGYAYPKYAAKDVEPAPVSVERLRVWPWERG